MSHRARVLKLEEDLARPGVSKCSCNLGLAAPTHQEVLAATFKHFALTA